MPVLIVSEKTSPHDGFSRKRVMRPSSSVTTTPNSSGLVTRCSAIVTSLSSRRWCSMSAVRSMSVSASPEMTRNVSPASSLSAILTAPAVPSGVSSTTYSIVTPNSAPLSKYDSTSSAR